MIPFVQDGMEGCPDEVLTVLYMVLSALIGTFMFVVYEITVTHRNGATNQKENS
jgi:hypothetical protein